MHSKCNRIGCDPVLSEVIYLLPCNFLCKDLLTCECDLELRNPESRRSLSPDDLYVGGRWDLPLTLLHAERPKLHTILAFQSAVGVMSS